MNQSQRLKNLSPLLLLLLLAFIIASFELEKENFNFAQKVELKDVKSLKADIKINAGQLNLSTHASTYAAITAFFTQAKWKPGVKMDEQSGTLSIHQPDEKNTNMEDEDKNEWQIKIPQSLATDLEISMGAGEGIVNLSNSRLSGMKVKMGAGKLDINLANSSLSFLEVNAGVGELTIDLSGRQNKNLETVINGGVGKVRLVLPAQVGVRVKASGLGSVDTHELTKEGRYYINDLYGETVNNIEVEVNGGLGSVELSLK